MKNKKAAEKCNESPSVSYIQVEGTNGKGNQNMKNHRLKYRLTSSCSVRKGSRHSAHPRIRHPEICRNAMLLALPALLLAGCYHRLRPSEEEIREGSLRACGLTDDCAYRTEEYQIYIPGPDGEPVETTVECMTCPVGLIWSWSEECGLGCSLTSLTLDDQSSESLELSRKELLEQNPKELHVEVSWDPQDVDPEITEEELLECLEKTFLAYLPVEKVTVKTGMSATEE